MIREQRFSTLALFGLLLFTIACADRTAAEAVPSQSSSTGATSATQSADPAADALLAELVPNYLPIMDSLADDSLPNAIAGAEAFESALLALDSPESQLSDLSLAAAGIRQATDIEAARGEFAELSKTMIALWRSAAEKSGTVVAHCSMADESWLQTDAPLSNPYYGSEMLRCGEVAER